MQSSTTPAPIKIRRNVVDKSGSNVSITGMPPKALNIFAIPVTKNNSPEERTNQSITFLLTHFCDSDSVTVAHRFSFCSLGAPRCFNSASRLRRCCDPTVSGAAAEQIHSASVSSHIRRRISECSSRYDRSPRRCRYTRRSHCSRCRTSTDSGTCGRRLCNWSALTLSNQVLTCSSYDFYC